MINWAELLEELLFNFSIWQGIIAILNTPYYPTSGGGGGGSDNYSHKDKDELEEEMRYARRCAMAAISKIVSLNIKEEGGDLWL